MSNNKLFGTPMASSAELTAVDEAKLDKTARGVASGVASLGTDGRVPVGELPSYVDEILEYATFADFPATGESDKIYLAKDTNLIYRWGGTQYAEVSQSLALGETEQTAFRGDHGKTAYDHATATGNPHGTTASDVGALPTTGGTMTGNIVQNTGRILKADNSSVLDLCGGKWGTVAEGAFIRLFGASTEDGGAFYIGSAGDQSGGYLNKFPGSRLKVGSTEVLLKTDCGVANYCASLNGTGKVPASQLPSYVDDVVEYANKASFPATGETGIIYVAKDTNKIYRWSGTDYIEISQSLALGTTVDSAYNGRDGLTAYNHANATGNPHGTTASDVNALPLSGGTMTGDINVGSNAVIFQSPDKLEGDISGNLKWAENNVLTSGNTSVSATGTATDEVSYIKINGVEKKIAPAGTGEFLPLSGGTMTGDVKLGPCTTTASGRSVSAVVNSANGSSTYVCGGTDSTYSSYLKLDGKDNGGNFTLKSVHAGASSTDYVDLVGNASTETLTWGGSPVPTVSSGLASVSKTARLSSVIASYNGNLLALHFNSYTGKITVNGSEISSGESVEIAGDTLTISCAYSSSRYTFSISSNSSIGAIIILGA